MSDPIDITESVAFAQLAAAIVGAAVFQDVPFNTPPPVVIVGDIAGSHLGGKGDVDMRGSLSIEAITEGQERKPNSDLCAQVRAILGDRDFAQDGFTISFDAGSSTVVLAGDGQTYVGTTAFTWFALAD